MLIVANHEYHNDDVFVIYCMLQRGRICSTFAKLEIYRAILMKLQIHHLFLIAFNSYSIFLDYFFFCKKNFCFNKIYFSFLKKNRQYNFIEIIRYHEIFIYEDFRFVQIVSFSFIFSKFYFLYEFFFVEIYSHKCFCELSF